MKRIAITLELENGMEIDGVVHLHETTLGEVKKLREMILNARVSGIESLSSMQRVLRDAR